MKKTSINFIYPNLWAPTAGLLQCLIVVQQCVYQMKFKNISRNAGTAWIGLEQNIIDTTISERRKCLLACVRIVGQHRKQFYCRQFKNGQLGEFSAKASEI